MSYYKNHCCHHHIDGEANSDNTEKMTDAQLERMDAASPDGLRRAVIARTG